MSASDIINLAEKEGYDTNEHEFERFLADGISLTANDKINDE